MKKRHNPKSQGILTTKEEFHLWPSCKPLMMPEIIFLNTKEVTTKRK